MTSRRSHIVNSAPIRRRITLEQPNTAARPPNAGGESLSLALSIGAIVIGIAALIGYAVGNASVAALSVNGKPVAVITAAVFIVLGAGLVALSRSASGPVAARAAAIVVAGISSADLLTLLFSRQQSEEWQVWAARGGVHLHQFPITTALALSLCASIYLITTRREFVSHLISSAVLLTGTLFLFAYALKVPSFLDPSGRLAPVPASTLGITLIAAAVLVARPRGWVVALFSHTAAGKMSRLLLPAAVAVPFLSLALRNLIADRLWFTPEVGLTVIVAANVFFGAAIVLGAALSVHQRAAETSRLAWIIASSDDAIIAASAAGLIESWNAGAEQMYGYRAEEAIGRPVTMLVPPERNEEEFLIDRIRRGERIDPFETVRLRKDGHRLDVALSVSPIFDDSGHVTGAASIAQDITGRRKDEEAIGRMAEQHAAVLATSTDAFWLADLDGRLLDVNDACCLMSGYSRQELLEMNLRDLEAFEKPEETARHMRNIVERGFDRFETKHRTRDGRIIDVEASVSRLNATGQILAFARDITRQKQEQEALRNSEERLQLAQQAAGFGHFSWDIKADVSTGSDRLMAMLGLPPGSPGESHERWNERIFPDDRATVAAETRKAMTSGELFCEFRVVWPDQSVHWLQSRAKVLFSSGGEPLRMVGVSMDITERMRIETEMRWKTALLEAQLDATADGILIVDPRGKKIVQNSRLAELWGIPADVASNDDDKLQIEFVKSRTTNPEQFVAKILYLYAHPDETSRDEVDLADGTILGRYSAPVIGNDGTRFGRIWVFRDITGKKLAAERLQKAMAELERVNRDLARSESALTEGQRVAQVGHWEWSALTGATSWSDEVYRILGIPAGSVTPSYELLFGIIGDKGRRRLEEEIALALGSSGSSDGVVVMDLPITTPSGLERVVSQRAHVDRDAAGNVVGFHGTCQDITERVRIEEALEKSEAALKDAQRIAAVGHWNWSAATGAATWSDETYRILGIPKDSVTPSYPLFLSMIVPTDRRRLEDRVALALEPGGETDIAIDVEIAMPAGAAAVISTRIEVERDDAGNVLTLHGTIQDITRRVATERALRDSEASLAEAQQIAHVGSWIVYPESGEVHASDETFRIYGLDPNPNMPLQSFVDRVHEEDRVRVEKEIAASPKTGKQDVEFRIETPRGTRVLHALARRREVGEARLSLIGTTQDITAQKAAEEKLRQHGENLERSNLELERFNRLAVGRELRMIDLKRQINDLSAQLGRQAPYAPPEGHTPAVETS